MRFSTAFFCINQAPLGHGIRISSDFDLFQKFAKILNLRLLCAVSMCAYCYSALAQHKHIVTTRMLSISIVKVKNC